jgi:hypothetical protein
MGQENFEAEQRERRSSERVPVNGAAAALEYGHIGMVYELVDISLGGAQLCGPQDPPADSFEILMHVSNRYWERRARQVWMRADCVGIEFESLDESVFDALGEDDDYGRDSSVLSSDVSALVIDGYTARAASMCKSLALLGCSSHVASTPLAAVEILDQKVPAISMVVIAPTVSGCCGTDLSSFIGVTYPGVKRILMTTSNGSRGSYEGVEGLLMADAIRTALGEMPVRENAGPALSPRHESRAQAHLLR